MYFYEIEVYYPFYENEKIIMGHDAHFDNHQLNIIVQEAFDECIEKYIDKTISTTTSENMFRNALIVNPVRTSANKKQYGLSIQNGRNYNENKT